jgi:hypothetical protein
MSLTVNTLTYANDVARSPDIYRYLGPNNTYNVDDYIDLYRTAPKPTATFAGVTKGAAKLTRTVTDGTDPVGTGIIETSSSLPVEAARAELEAMIDDHATWLLTSAAKDLLIDREINQ